jgi:hypothetical protein
MKQKAARCRQRKNSLNHGDKMAARYSAVKRRYSVTRCWHTGKSVNQEQKLTYREQCQPGTEADIQGTVSTRNRSSARETEKLNQRGNLWWSSRRDGEVTLNRAKRDTAWPDQRSRDPSHRLEWPQISSWSWSPPRWRPWPLYAVRFDWLILRKCRKDLLNTRFTLWDKIGNFRCP